MTYVRLYSIVAASDALVEASLRYQGEYRTRLDAWQRLQAIVERAEAVGAEVRRAPWEAPGGEAYLIDYGPGWDQRDMIALEPEVARA